MTIGEKIRDIRMKRGLTQADLGGDLVTPSMISQIEADRAKPSYPLLTEIANRLGMPVEYFMNEMDNQFLLSAQMNIAMYENSIGNPSEGLEALESVPEVPEQGLTHQDYDFAAAQTYRKLKRFSEAISKLEHLREIAYRSQNQRLLFMVCSESGYVEADLGNHEGAYHEWTRAVEIGQELLAKHPSSRMEVTTVLTEVLLQLDQLTSAAEPNQTDRPYLWQAHKLTAQTPNLRAMSDQLIEDAKACLTVDAAHAKSLAEKANVLLAFSRLIEHVVVTQTRLASISNTPETDPWRKAAQAATAVSPGLLLSAECDQIERLIEEGNFEDAEVKLAEAHLFIDESSLEALDEATQAVCYRLRLFEAQLLNHRKQQSEALQVLTDLVDNWKFKTDASVQMKACALLVLWYGEQGTADKVLYYCKQMERLMVSPKDQTPLMI